MKNIDDYKVYCHINKINNKKYYGITMQDVKQRWRNGHNYRPKYEKHNSRFYNAILKYGWDNFEHIILYEGLSKKEAELLEQELIHKYNTTNPEFGYNIQSGGNSKGRNTEEIRKRISEGRKKKVLQIDKKDYSIIKVWNSGEDVVNELGVQHSNLSKALNKQRFGCGGYIWRFEKDYLDIEDISILIEEEVSAWKASRKKPCFSEDGLKKANLATSKKVIQIDIVTKEIIAYYPSISEASRVTNIGISNISYVCRKEHGTAGGYMWMFLEDYSYLRENNLSQAEFTLYMIDRYGIKNNKNKNYNYKPRKNKKIIQLDLEYNLVKIWDRNKCIEDELGIKSKRICDVCRGRRKSTRGYIFMYLDDYEEVKNCNYSTNEIRCWVKKKYNN